jgi:hypothetical protein
MTKSGRALFICVWTNKEAYEMEVAQASALQLTQKKKQQFRAVLCRNGCKKFHLKRRKDDEVDRHR